MGWCVCLQFLSYKQNYDHDKGYSEHKSYAPCFRHLATFERKRHLTNNSRGIRMFPVHVGNLPTRTSTFRITLLRMGAYFLGVDIYR